MEQTAYEHATELSADVQADSWAHVRRPGEPTGIALDPVMFAIWSVADGHTLTEVAHSAQVSTYLASCAIAVLQHAGLLQGQAPTRLSRAKVPTQAATGLSTSVIILHRNPQADVDRCVDSVLGQEAVGLAEITMVAPGPVVTNSEVRLVECRQTTLAHALVEQMEGVTTGAILVLDSRVDLAPGSLAEMVRALQLPGRIAAVTPRVMWNSWARFVVQLGDWRTALHAPRNPYAGHLDVGQFERRWQELPATSTLAGMTKRETLQQLGTPDGAHGLDWMGVDWCHRARQQGYHVLGAAQALAYGPWTGEDTPAEAATKQTPSSHREDKAPLSPGPGPMVHKGKPALSIDQVRAMYGQYPTITSLAPQRRIAFVAGANDRHQAMAEVLSSQYQVSWMAPSVSDEALRSSCETADLVITTARQLEKMAFLQGWHRPIVVDMQPPIAKLESPEQWPQAVDGLLCASEEERQYWLGKLAPSDGADPRAEAGVAALDDLVRVVRTGVEPVAAATEPILRSLHAEIGAEDRVILWVGGLRFFDDPWTAIHAFGKLRETRNHVKLVFVAFEDKKQDEQCLAAATRLVSKVGLARSVLFVENVPAHQQSGMLAEADLAIMLGTDRLEARLHEPVGLAACIGAGLPMVITSGRSGSGLVQQFGLGQTVPIGDVPALVKAMTDSLGTARSAYQERFQAAREALAWSKTIRPLAQWCQPSRFALEQEASALLHVDMLLPDLPEPTSLWDLPAKTWQTLSQLGVRSTIREAVRYLRWKMGG